MEFKAKLSSLKESLIVGGFFIVVFLPVRLLFFTYVSDHWFGNLGVLSAMMFLIVWLSYRKKLGYLGELVIKKLNKIRNSKVTKYFIIMQLFSIYIIGSSFIGISAGESSASLQMVQETLIASNISDVESFHELAYDNVEILDFVLLIPLMFLLPFFEFELYSAMLHSIDNLYDGWLSHFLAITFIEILESFAIVVYFRYVKK